MTQPTHIRVAVVGAGFAGLGAGVALKRAGVEFAILERAADVGGTWRDNSYPGCRCDVSSHLYSFSFAPNPDWTETFSRQPEIQAYLRRTAEEHGLIPHIRFGHEVREAAWQPAEQHWRLDTGGGIVTADVLLMGNGPLAEPALPDVPGLDRFTGTAFHSALWRHDHDLTGRRVAVIGTGASAIQFVPEIQPQVASLTLFQRTPPWVLPHPNRKIPPTLRKLYRRFPLLQKALRYVIYWRSEIFVTSMLRKGNFLDKVGALSQRHLAAAVADPNLRAKLTPDYTPGCKRLLLSNDYYPALAQPNVDVVTEKIIEVTDRGVVTADGIEHPVDTIIFGTGFKVTDNPVAQRIRGADGRTLEQHWRQTGQRAYKGTAVPAFPNLFLLAGPNTGIGHTSLVVMIEAQLRYVVDALRTMEAYGARSVEVLEKPCADFNDRVQRKAARTVWNAGGCASWYLDANGRNTTLWPDYTWKFALQTRHFDADAYVLGSR